ncbi:MAG: acyl-CoA dehydrogenase domain protein [Acidimicrobiales bacterium]|jgi:alkylation response protein AidB-like acyl-CoA dehydrogenase|nr:acyl-CoA dehydrogenase domain protein [Acidimicrobiales bacterium]
MLFRRAGRVPKSNPVPHRYHRGVFRAVGDQELFQETTRRFLEVEVPLAKVRDLAGTTDGYEPSFWRQGAQLGWTSLLVPEDAGGGSISGHGVVDLALVAYEFGLHAAPGPLIGTNVVAAALGRWGTDDQRAGPLADLLAGDAAGAWAHAEPAPNDGLGDLALTATRSGDGFSLHGVKSPVEAGRQAAYILVSARHESGPTQFLIPSNAPGLMIKPLHGLDMTRRHARLEFDGVTVPSTHLVGRPGSAGANIDWLLDLAVSIQLAEMCGALTWAFDTTVDWAFNRYSFGRPLASYQELKHRFADMKMWLEASCAISADAAAAMDRDQAQRSERVSAGKFYVGRYGPELMQDCVQMHGGIGVTFDHDLHLFLRRIVTDVPTYGTPGQHAARLTGILAGADR